MPELYSAAKVVVWPSLHEGFGLPSSVQAMARQEKGRAMGDRLIIDCRNLIGDTIYLIKPLRQFLASRRLGQVALGVSGGLPGEIVERSFPGVRVGPMEVLEAAWPGADGIALSARSAWEKTRSDNGHISQGYGRILGMELTGSIEPDVAWLPTPEPALRREHVALAPFSVSCARHRGEPPNKTISEPDWVPLLEILRGYGWPLRVIGGPTERFSMHELGFSEADYFSAGGIDDLVSCLRQSWLVIGVDTGICHVSSCAGIPTVVLWSSAASLQFIGETWAPRTRLVHIGSPAGLDGYRVGGLLADAVKYLLGWEARTTAQGPEASARICGQLHSPDGEGAVRGVISTPPNDPVVPANERAVFPVLDSSIFIPMRYGSRGLRHWSGHLPFARDLVASLRPRLLVELGTHDGESYFGFCQSVAETGGPCACYAVDTWSGDPHAAANGEDVYGNVQRYNSERYASFSYLLRTSFDDALEWFSEGSIDLLHIDELHTYEAAKHSFDTWYPKVAPGGIVLVHGIADRHASFGVGRFWQEISQAHDTFEFHQCYGLGVIRKPGARQAHGGILDCLFPAGNADRIRRYYVSCGERLDRRADAAAGTRPSQGPVLTDPPADLVSALTGPVGTGEKRCWIELPLAEPALLRNDSLLWDQKPNTWRASTPDPWIVCSADLDCSCFRFFVLVMSCSCEAPQPYAQLFWSGPQRPGFDERFSVRFPAIPDGQSHTYVVDLHAGAESGALNYLWWHRGKIDTIRLDPLDTPGEFTITLAGFAHQDWAESDYVRDGLYLLPLRTELSYRYLCGSGIEIGALQGPLELRPGTHIRYADRLTVEDTRAQHPELNQFPLVTPTIICDPAGLTPVAEQSVDFVIANLVLEDVPDPLAAVGEWLRVVRPGGYVYVAVPDHTRLDCLNADLDQREGRKDLDRLPDCECGASMRPDLPQGEQASPETQPESSNYAIPVHMFSQKTFADFMGDVVTQFPADLIELRRASAGDAMEYIAILRKL